jgi:hypothetical protein
MIDHYYYRNEVLDAHLLLEDQVNTLLEMAFQIKLPASFSNNYSKLDLLLDLNIVDDQFKQDFQLFSQIRNQFIHVLGCNSFVELSESKRKRLLKSQNLSFDYLEDNEHLFEALKSLFARLMKDFMPRVQEAIQKGSGPIRELNSLQASVADLIDYICDKYPAEDRSQLEQIFKKED